MLKVINIIYFFKQLFGHWDVFYETFLRRERGRYDECKKNKWNIISKNINNSIHNSDHMNGFGLSFNFKL